MSIFFRVPFISYRFLRRRRKMTTPSLKLLGENVCGGGKRGEEKNTVKDYCIEKRIVTYSKENLRAPSLRQILRWSKPLGINPAEARAASDRAPYRHALGKVFPHIFDFFPLFHHIFSRSWLGCYVKF